MAFGDELLAWRKAAESQPLIRMTDCPVCDWTLVETNDGLWCEFCGWTESLGASK